MPQLTADQARAQLVKDGYHPDRAAGLLAKARQRGQWEGIDVNVAYHQADGTFTITATE